MTRLTMESLRLLTFSVLFLYLGRQVSASCSFRSFESCLDGTNCGCEWCATYNMCQDRGRSCPGLTSYSCAGAWAAASLAGLVIGLIVAALVCVCLCVWAYRRRRYHRQMMVPAQVGQPMYATQQVPMYGQPAPAMYGQNGPVYGQPIPNQQYPYAQPFNYGQQQGSNPYPQQQQMHPYPQQQQMNPYPQQQQGMNPYPQQGMNPQ